jgi:hypothetical protein
MNPTRYGLGCNRSRRFEIAPCLDCTISIKVWTTSGYFYILKWTLLTIIKRLCPNSTMHILIKRNWNECWTLCFAHVNTIQNASHLIQYGENGLNILRCNLIILPTLRGNLIIPTHINTANPYILQKFTALPCFPFVFLLYFLLLGEKHRLMGWPGAFTSHRETVERVDNFHENSNEFYAIRFHTNLLRLYFL